MSYYEDFVPDQGTAPDPLCGNGPCLDLVQDQDSYYQRDLADSKSTTKVPDPPNWKIAYTTIVLVLMFAVLITDKYGPDAVLMAALAAFLSAEVVTVKEAVEGFSNEGVLTVLVLFIVADGVIRTGGLDWYMTRMLGRPKTMASAQLRLMLPLAAVSAFFNNSPIVLVMVPVVQRWCRNTGMSVKQLLVPMSFAVVLGGTCTIIGTSTNLVVTSQFKKRYPKEEEITMFDLSPYGVPVALVGITYMLLASPFLLPDGERSCRKHSGTPPQDSHGDDVLLGARVTKWSPAADRTIKRSGLRDTGGIYLVSVHRAATGNIHRAVSNDFVLNVGDILYFTGQAESFGTFCDEHALEMVTTELDLPDGKIAKATITQSDSAYLAESVPNEIGVTKESLLDADADERLRSIHQMTDTIRNSDEQDDNSGELKTPNSSVQQLRSGDPPKVVVAVDQFSVLVGIDVQDRPGLLLDVSKALLRLSLQIRHTDAAVLGARSVSVWRCEVIENKEVPDVEEVWSVLNSLLSNESGAEAVKKRGQRVIRAVVTKQSRLLGKTAGQMNFRELYDAALIALQKGDRTISTAQRQQLSAVPFDAGDVLLLQVGEGSLLLRRPPANFYEPEKKRGSVLSSEALDAAKNNGDFVDEEHGSNQVVWNDLKILFKDEDDHGLVRREFLTAMVVAPKAPLVGKSVTQIGITQLPDLYLVSIDRPVLPDNDKERRQHKHKGHSDLDTKDDASVQTTGPSFTSIDTDEPLQEGDVLWYSGPASVIGDLRKIPGLVSYVDIQVQKMNQKLHDRKMVQAVIARSGPLVGKTVKESRFRTRYGAAVIAIHRNGNRVHELPGKVTLQGGDVLLLDAGPNFIKKSAETDRAFALLLEVKDSAPPRLALFFPSVVLVAGMIGVYAADLCSLLTSAMVAAVIMITTGIMSEQEARDAIKWDIFMAVASAFGIGTAMSNGGVARAIANFLVDVGDSFHIGDAGVIGAVYLGTFLVSNVLQNNAAAALTFPVAMDAADKAGTDRVMMAFTVMFGASASFAVPFAYTTNLLIFGPGGYTTLDFMMFGAPMHLVLWPCTVLILVVIRPWYISWLITGAILALAASARLLSSALHHKSKQQDAAKLKEGTEMVEVDGTS